MIKLICTLGPSTLNNKSLKELKNIGVNLFRLNLSHLSITQLKKKISFLKKNNIKNICIDTEGAQIRTTKVQSKIYLKKNYKLNLSSQNKTSNKKNIFLYPSIGLKSININTEIEIGFENLKVVVLKNNGDHLFCKVISPGYLESNKGVHFKQEIKLNYLTEKDIKAIEIGKKENIKFYALSFANSEKDVLQFRKLINRRNSFIISKVETLNALKNFLKISKASNATLLDRGDLSRYIAVEKIPLIQMNLLKKTKKINKQMYVATNLLESMVNKPYPTRAESNDIFFTLISGAKGLVLAAETAIGKYPIECALFIKRCIKNFKENNFKIK
jgi:pyruvate kinase